MLEKHKMNRINELARVSKERTLDENEKAEQAVLRAEYLEKFRESFKTHLDCIKLVPKDAPEEVSGNAHCEKTGIKKG